MQKTGVQKTLTCPGLQPWGVAWTAEDSAAESRIFPLPSRAQGILLLPGIKKKIKPYTVQQIRGLSSPTEKEQTWIYLAHRYAACQGLLGFWPSFPLLFQKTHLFLLSCFFFLLKTLQVHIEWQKHWVYQWEQMDFEEKFTWTIRLSTCARDKPFPTITPATINANSSNGASYHIFSSHGFFCLITQDHTIAFPFTTGLLHFRYLFSKPFCPSWIWGKLGRDLKFFEKANRIMALFPQAAKPNTIKFSSWCFRSGPLP